MTGFHWYSLIELSLEKGSKLLSRFKFGVDYFAFAMTLSNKIGRSNPQKQTSTNSINLEQI